MLSADPIVQEPHNAQNLNRYSYVVNNPLSYTDPSGLSFWKKYGRTIAGIAITAFMPTMGAFFKTLGGRMITGFLSGAVSSGSLKGGLWGAFSAGVFHGIGKGFDKLASANKGASGLIAGLKPDQFAAKVLTHAAMGGVMSQLQGGKFGHGFISAGVVEALSPQIMRAKGGPAQVVVGALVGGTASAASGGKFGNGALTAAFQIAFNHLSDSFLRRHNYESLGGDCYVRVDPDPIGEGVTSVEVHVYTEETALDSSAPSNVGIALHFVNMKGASMHLIARRSSSDGRRSMMLACRI